MGCDEGQTGEKKGSMGVEGMQTNGFAARNKITPYTFGEAVSIKVR